MSSISIKPIRREISPETGEKYPKQFDDDWECVECRDIWGLVVWNRSMAGHCQHCDYEVFGLPGD